MAVERSSGSSFKKKRSGGGFGSGHGGFFSLLLRIVLIIFVLMCFFGMINQAKLGKSMFSWFYDTGMTIGHQIEYIFTGEEKSIVDVTDQGIYAKGYAPDGSTSIDINDIGSTDTSTETDSSDKSSDNSSNANTEGSSSESSTE